jgi:hypothetical protein
MSKENALRFMIIKDKDESIKNAYDSVIGKHREKNLSEAEQDNVLREEIVSLAKQCGFDFTPQEMIDLKETAKGKLSDEELDEIVGGRGGFSRSLSITFDFPHLYNLTATTCCDSAPDDNTFRKRYMQSITDCPNYIWSNYGSDYHACNTCKNCRFGFGSEQIF